MTASDPARAASPVPGLSPLASEDMLAVFGDSLIGFPADLGIEAPGGEVPVLKTMGFSPSEALEATVPLESDDLSTYTAVWDIRLDALPGAFLSLFQTDPSNGSDGDLFVRDDGGLGINGTYDGTVPAGAWTRIAITVEDRGDGTATLSKYVDGSLAGSQTVDAARFTLQSNADLLLLADNSGETGPAALSHFGLLPEALSESGIAALGGVDADGPFDAPDPDADPAPRPAPLRLTDAATNSAGGAFTKETVATDGLTFESRFEFRIVTPSGTVADGITFQLQTKREGEPLLGDTAGGSLGLPEAPFPGVTVVFDTFPNGFDDASNQIRILVGGDAESTPDAQVDAPLDLASSDTIRAWVEYDGTDLAVFVSGDDTKPASPTLSLPVDLSGVLGETATFGVSGATGGSFSIHDILSWELSTSDAAGPRGQILAEDRDALDLFGTAERLAPIDFDPDAPLQLGFDGQAPDPEFGFSSVVLDDVPTVESPIRDRLLAETGESFDLAEVFGDGATGFSVTSSDGEVVEARIRDGVLTLAPGELGHADITVTATSANGATLEDNFRAIVAGPNAYSFAVLPDTQSYTSSGDPSIQALFGSMVDYVVDHRDALGIQHAIHVGDIVEFGAVEQWEIAEDAIERMDGELGYTLAVGNHDQQRPGFASAFSFESDIDRYFTPEQVGATPAQGGGLYDGFDVGEDVFGNGDTYSDSIRNAYSTLTAPDGTDWLIFSLEFGAPDDVLRWAGEVIEDHLDHRVIIDTHSWNGGDKRVDPTTEPLTGENGGWGYAIRANPRNANDGEDMWRELASKYPNVTFTFNGHNFLDGAETVVSETAGGNDLYQIFVNYQNGIQGEITGAGDPALGGRGGNGAFRLVVIDPDNDRLTTHTKFTGLDTFFERVDHQEVFEDVALEAPEQIAIAKAGGTETVQGPTVTLDPSATLLPDGPAGLSYRWVDATGETLGETSGAPLAVELPYGVHRLTLEVEDARGNVSTDDKTVLVETAGTLLSETFDDGDAAGWQALAEAGPIAETGTDLGFGIASIDGVGQIPLSLRFDSSFRPYDAMTGEVLVSFDDGQSFSSLLTLDTATIPGGTSSLARANETVTLDTLVPNSASEVQFAWRLSQADNDWWWAIDAVEAFGPPEEILTEVWSEDFDGLAPSLMQAVDESPTPPDLLGWTHSTPPGWERTVDAPQGTTEWQGWSFATPEFWIAADNQSRDSFTKGSGVIAIADGDEWDDNNTGSVTGDDFNTMLTTDAVALDGLGTDAGPVDLALTFDSSFRPYDAMTGEVLVSFDGGEFESLLTLDASTAGGNSSLSRGNATERVDVTAPERAEEVRFLFDYRDADSDWWWAIDNLSLSTVEETAPRLFAEDFEALALRDAVDEAPQGTGVWTPTPPEGWSRDNAPTMPQGITEWQGWSFADKDFWIDVAGNQDRDSFARGEGTVAIADGDEWADGGAASGATDSFDSTLTTPGIDITGVGGGQPAGEAAGVARIGALGPEQGLLVTPGATGRFDAYSIVFDLYVPSDGAKSFSALYQTDASNSGDADIYLRDDGGIGISGVYDGQEEFAFDAWTRVALTVSVEDGAQVLRKYVDGTLVGTQTVADDATGGTRWSIDADTGFLLFSEPNDFTSDLFVNAVAFTPEVLDEQAVGALGGVDLDGPLDGAASPDAFQLSFDGATDAADFGAVEVESIDNSSGLGSYLVKGSIFGNPQGEGEAAVYAQSDGANEILLWQGDGAADWSDYVLDMVVEPADNDTLGAVFYWQDAENHYELTINQQEQTRTLTRVSDGEATVLAEEAGDYRHFAPQDLRIAVGDGEITATLGEELLFGGPVTDDDPLSSGTVGLLSRFMDRLEFDNVMVTGQALSARALGETRARDTDGDGSETLSLTAAGTIAPDAVASYDWLIGGSVVATGETAEIVAPAGETEVTLRVTDTTGAVSEDSLAVEVVARQNIRLDRDFSGDPESFTFVDEGDIDAPSDWSIVDGALQQDSPIRSEQQETGFGAWSLGGEGAYILRDGTYALFDRPDAYRWTDYAVETEVTPGSDGGFGILFRYSDPGTYYKLELDSSTGVIQLTRHEDGYETVLGRGWDGFTPGEGLTMRVEADGDRLGASIDGVEVFGSEITDDALGSGTMALYSWGSTGLRFEDVAVTGPDIAPTAVGDAAATPADTAVTLDLTGNDIDEDPAGLALAGVADGAAGTVALDAGAAVYTPAPGFEGVDSFRYLVEDAAGNLSEGLAAVTVGTPAPAAEPDGVLRGTERADSIVVGQNAIYLGAEDEDIFVVSGAARPGTSVIDGDGDMLQLVGGVEVIESLVLADALSLTLSTGAVVQVLEASGLDYEIGGNVTTGEVGTRLSYEDFARQVLGVAVPEDEAALPGGPVIVEDPADTLLG